MDPMESANRRRFFVRAGPEIAHLFSFEQKKDGSIYWHSHDFETARFLVRAQTPDGPGLAYVEQLGKGKMSLHRSGAIGVRPHASNTGHYLRVNGVALANRSKGTHGVRHLLTYFGTQPTRQTKKSPLFSRSTDYWIDDNVPMMRPMVFILLAIPRVQQLTLSLNFSFQIDEMEDVRQPTLGWGAFALREHNVVWLGYRTRHMDAWPQQAQVVYDDGFHIPFLVCTAPGELRVEGRRPSYTLQGDELTISAHHPAEIDSTAP